MGRWRPLAVTLSGDNATAQLTNGICTARCTAQQAAGDTTWHVLYKRPASPTCAAGYASLDKP